MQNKTALLLIGSPKTFGSSSENIGRLLLEYFAENGFNTEIEHIGAAQRKGTIIELIQKTNSADITIISTPLYVDSLPAPLIKFLEWYCNDDIKKEKSIIGIVNSGFPESFHNSSAIEILRLFSVHNNFNWIGGFSIGGGGALNKTNLRKSKMARNITEAFKVAADHLSKGEPVPDEIFTLASKPMMPISIYLFFGQLGWYLQSIKYRTFFKLWAKPYAN